jgi:hypothetical protein
MKQPVCKHDKFTIYHGSFTARRACIALSNLEIYVLPLNPALIPPRFMSVCVLALCLDVLRIVDTRTDAV